MRQFRLRVIIFFTVWLGIASLAEAKTTIQSIRYGAHTDFDRIVFEFSAPVDCRIETLDTLHLRIHLGLVDVSRYFRVEKLPKGMSLISSARASGGGKAPFVLDIRLHQNAATNSMILKGTPSRTVVDITAMQLSRPVKTSTKKKEPEYVPGDRPFRTKFAETTTPSDEIDDAKIHAIFAYYFATTGDSEKALQEAEIYEALTGHALALGFKLEQRKIPTPQVTQPTSPYIIQRWFKLDYLIAFLAGIMGYAFSVVLSILIGWWKRRHPAKQADNLLNYAKKIRDVVDKAAASEQTTSSKTEPPAKKTSPSTPAPSPPVDEPTPEPAEVETLKESAAERRTKRVMELSKKGKSISDISQELEMSQDEVKLILDLNQ